MRNRQPADQRMDPYVSRTGGTMARSPSERLEPTRPPAKPRRRKDNREPRRSRPFLRFLNGMLTFVLLLMLLVGAVAYVFDSQIDAPGPLEQAKTVVIPKGEGTHEIASRLEREGIVTDRRLFIAGYLWTKLSAAAEGSKPVQLKAGDYAVKPSSSVRQVIDLLCEGKTMTYRVTIPEGLTSYQIVERLKADANLTGEIEAVPPEGTLLPETFIIERGMPRQAVVDRMQAEARKVIEKAWGQRKKELPFKSAEEALVLASIVEKETGRGDERERVAAVFVNRLRQNMRLQSDPTILYGQTLRQDRVEPADPEERDRAEDLAQHLSDRRPAADADLQPGPRRDRGRAQSGRHQGAVFRRRRRRRPRLLGDAEGPQRQRAEVATGGEGHQGQGCAARRRHADHGRAGRCSQGARRRAHRAASPPDKANPPEVTPKR